MLGRHDMTDPAWIRAPASSPAASEPVRARVRAAGVVASYAVAAFLIYFGALKVSASQAQALEPLLTHSPLFSWVTDRLGAAETAKLLVGLELATALLLIASPISPRLSLIGSLLAMLIFAATLSFLATTPGSFVRLPDFPVPAPSPMAAFLLKDVFLLLSALFVLLESIRAIRRT